MKYVAANTPTSYNTHIEIASANIETMSGGVMMAAMTKAMTMK